MVVRRVKGVQKVDGNAKAKTLIIQFDPEITSVEDIKKAMVRIGYEAEMV